MDGRPLVRSRVVGLLVAAILAVGCGSAAPGSTSSDAPPSPSASTTVQPSPARTPRPPLEVTLPGLGEATVLNEASVTMGTDADGFALTLTRRALWFNREQGVLVYRLVEGDFRISATVWPQRASDGSQPLRGQGIVELGGLMARAPSVGLENYVFVVVGNDPDGQSVETKSTTDNVSTYDGPAWDQPMADLRLCRIGDTFTAWKRHSGTREAWNLAASWQRPDLPAELQVGVNIYANDRPDLLVRFDGVELAPASTEQCPAG